MGGTSQRKTAYLTLEELTADRELARRLPLDLAWSCHALPLAEDNGRVTVVMADPDDDRAREAVVAALGPRLCVVKGSPLSIEARLAEIWGDEACRRPRLEVCAFPDPLPGELWDYAQALGVLLGAHLGRMSTAGEVNALAKEGGRANSDLVILGEYCHPLLRCLLSRSTEDGDLPILQSAVPFGILVAQRPRWPLERILLVICGESADNGAVDWALRLASPSTAAVTVLAVIPPVPIMVHGPARREQGMAAFLTSNTILGRQMHQVARRLAECQVDGTLRLRQGAPDQQICRQVVEGDHDLIIMAARPRKWWLRQLKGDPICSLLSQVDRPVLFAEPDKAGKSDPT